LIPITVTPKKDTLPIVTPQNKPITVCKPTITDMGPGATMTTCSGTTSTSHGKMVLNAITGCFTYLPDSNYVGKDTGCIIVCKNGICDTTIVPIEVTSISITPKIDLRKTVESIEIQPDGNYLIRFKIKATNPMSFNVDSVTIQDDLTKVFPSVNDFSVATVTASGTLEKNGLYNGVGVIDLVTPASTLGAGKSDSVYLSVIVMPSAAGKQLNNVAIIQGKTPFGKVVQPSDDPSVNPTDTSGTTNRDATPFIIPASEVIIPGGFSPNKDGTDDAYRITAPTGSTVALIVFNRWGNKVFQSDDYKNDWRGEGPGTVWGDYVPMGTYYYIVSVKYTSGEVKKFSGPLTLVR
jgi:gliding motility-associated-like protein